MSTARRGMPVVRQRPEAPWRRELIVPEALIEGFRAPVAQRLLDLLEFVDYEADRHRRSARRWSRVGGWLGAGGALGAGTGGVAAIDGLGLPGWAQVPVVIAAFSGAGASAAAGSLRAPERLTAATQAADALDATSRRVRAMLTVDLPDAPHVDNATQLLREALTAVEHITGVEVPPALQQFPRPFVDPPSTELRT